MAFFRINIHDGHLNFSAKLHDDTLIHYGFKPESEIFDEGFYSPFALTTFATLGVYSLYLFITNPIFGSAALATYSHILDSLVSMGDGNGQIVKEKNYNTENAEYKIYKDLDLTQEAALLNFIDNKKSNVPEYDIYKYNCASFVKDAFCAVYPDECSSFKELVKNEVYNDPSINNFIAITFLNYFDMLS